MPKSANDSADLALLSVTKRFGAHAAVDDVDFTVAPGEFFSILGPSGCGKTTLLRAIAGLDRQTSGAIHINGRDVSDAPPSERDFGIVFQSYALFPNLTLEKIQESLGSIYSFLETTYGMRMIRAEERLRAVAADQFAAEHLAVKVGTPLLCVDRIAFTYGDKPVELRRGLYRTAYEGRTLRENLGLPYAAFGKAVEAGREAFLAGRIPRKRYASASSPVDGLIS